MKTTIAASSLLAVGALAGPLATRQNTNIDPTILQFALTLEHLENNFYHGALQKFSLQDFINAGYSADYYNNLKYISFDEQSHVQLLSGALSTAGYTPVAACQYKFPYTDVKSFITLSSILEGVGTSAYLAGAPLITSKSYLTVAGSILVAEALHTSMQRSAIGEVPMANPYGTPLDPNSVYTLAAMFISTCPSTNAPLPFVPFPTLSYTPNPACYCEEPDCSPSGQIKKRGGEWGTWFTLETKTKTAHVADASINGGANGYPSGNGGNGGNYNNNGGNGGNGNYNNGNNMPTMTSGTYMSSGTNQPSMTSGGYNIPTTSGSYTNTYSTSTSSASSMATSGCTPPSAGAYINLTAASNIPAGSYVTFVSGLNVVSVQGEINGMNIKVQIPSVAAGQTYVFISNADQEGTLVDANILFGPAIVEVNPAAPAIDYSVN